VVTESEAAREAVLSQLGELQANLERRGLRLAEFQVTVGVPALEAEVPAEEGALPLRSDRRQILDVIA